MIPSLLQIPSAVSDSKLHSVLPNNGKGDFTFDRSTGATRINKDGLIEEVGYFSSELVQNGNFSELGSELITNGDFATNSDWSDVNNVSSIINGQLVFNNNSFGGKFQNTSMVVGKTYKLVYTIVSISNGYIQPRLGDTGLATQRTSAGTYTEYVVCAVDSIFRLYGASSDAIVDNVSVKQVDPNNRFELDSASYGQNKVTLTSVGGAMTYIKQTGLNLEANKTYLIKINATKLSGDTNLALGSNGTNNVSGSPIISTNGFKRYYFTPASDIAHIGIKRNFGGSGAVWEITSFSIVEVQGDRPRLSYDITNGVVEDKPHLLLEPSSTNLYVNSEPTANEGAASGVSYVDFNWSLGFTNATEFTSGDFRYGGSVSASTVNSLSFFIIMDDLSQPVVGANSGAGDFSVVIGGSLMTSGFEVKNFGNNVYRVCVTGTSGTNTTNNGIVKYNSQSSKSFKVVGWQLEQQAFNTSYIKTAGTTITRAAETCNNSKPSVNSTEGVLYAEVAALANDGTNRAISISDGTTSNVVRFYYSTTDNRIVGNVKSGGSSVFNFNNVLSDATNFLKIAVSYKANDFKMYVDGTEVSTDTSGSAPVGLIEVAFDNGAGNDDFYGKVKGLAVYNEALSESQLMQLTGVTASSIYNNFVTRTASFTVEALNEVKKVIDNL